MSNLNDQSVVITATVAPLKNGKRRVIVSAAPDGEMPVVRSGNFSELKTLFDAVWVELLKRKPQVIKHKAQAEKPQPAPAADESMTDGPVAIEPETAEPVQSDAVTEEPDQLVRITGDATAPEQQPLF